MKLLNFFDDKGLRFLFYEDTPKMFCNWFDFMEDFETGRFSE